MGSCIARETSQQRVNHCYGPPQRCFMTKTPCCDEKEKKIHEGFILFIFGCLVAHIIKGGARSRHHVVMKFSIAATVITKLRYILMIWSWSYSGIHSCKNWLWIYKLLINLLCSINQNSLDIDPLHRHDVPRHEVKKVICTLCDTEQDVSLLAKLNTLQLRKLIH